MREACGTSICENGVPRFHSNTPAKHVVPAGVGQEPGTAGDHGSLTDIPHVIGLRCHRRSHAQHGERRLAPVNAVVDGEAEPVLPKESRIWQVKDAPPGIIHHCRNGGDFRSRPTGGGPLE